MLGKTVPQPKGNFLMELADLPFHGSALSLSPAVRYTQRLQRPDGAIAQNPIGAPSDWRCNRIFGKLKLDLKALTCSRLQAEKQKSVEKVLRILFYMFCFSINFWLVFSKFVGLHELEECLHGLRRGKTSMCLWRVKFPYYSILFPCVPCRVIVIKKNDLLRDLFFFYLFILNKFELVLM